MSMWLSLYRVSERALERLRDCPDLVGALFEERDLTDELSGEGTFHPDRDAFGADWRTFDQLLRDIHGVDEEAPLAECSRELIDDPVYQLCHGTRPLPRGDRGRGAAYWFAPAEVKRLAEELGGETWHPRDLTRAEIVGEPGDPVEPASDDVDDDDDSAVVESGDDDFVVAESGDDPYSELVRFVAVAAERGYAIVGSMS